MFPKTGNKLHSATGGLDFAQVMAEALNAELGSTHRAVKTAMQWTGASERTVKHWLAATHAPHGVHLVRLARHSERVLAAFLIAANRSDLLVTMELLAVRAKLLEVIDLLGERP